MGLFKRKPKPIAAEPIMSPVSYAEALLQAKANANKYMNENLALKTELTKKQATINSLVDQINKIKKVLKEVIE